MAIITLNKSGRAFKIKQSTWTDGFREGHWGYYGDWATFNIEPMEQRTVVTDASIYQGDGMHYLWHIRWS